MGQLYLVRHAQASFGAADYDQLSALGERQSLRLGEYFAGKGLVFEAVITGSLRRHAQTFSGIAQGAGLAHSPLVVRQGLTQWADGALAPVGMPTYAEFTHCVREALDHVRR